jgi:hypothetical protein
MEGRKDFRSGLMPIPFWMKVLLPRSWKAFWCHHSKSGNMTTEFDPEEKDCADTGSDLAFVPKSSIGTIQATRPGR